MLTRPLHLWPKMSLPGWLSLRRSPKHGVKCPRSFSEKPSWHIDFIILLYIYIHMNKTLLYQPSVIYVFWRHKGEGCTVDWGLWVIRCICNLVCNKRHLHFFKQTVLTQVRVQNAFAFTKRKKHSKNLKMMSRYRSGVLCGDGHCSLLSNFAMFCYSR